MSVIAVIAHLSAMLKTTVTSEATSDMYSDGFSDCATPMPTRTTQPTRRSSSVTETVLATCARRGRSGGDQARSGEIGRMSPDVACASQSKMGRRNRRRLVGGWSEAGRRRRER